LTEDAVQIVPPRRSPLRRLGCVVGLVIWFTVLLLPCFLLILATQSEITISTGSAPGQQTRLWLISEADERGLALSTTSAWQDGENALCVQTDVRFLLWAGSSEPLSYCECYQRGSAGEAWSFTESINGACTE
jgi:hypothetical protein